MFHAMPVANPNAPVTEDFFDDRWKWILAVANAAYMEGDLILAARIGLMTELWNRRVLKEEGRYQFGRLTPAPLGIEQRIYVLALQGVEQLPRASDVVGSGEAGWTASKLFDQLARTATGLASSGTPIHPELQALSSREPRFADDQAVAVGEDVVDRMYGTLQDARAGDEMSAAHMEGMALWAGGRTEEALIALSQAAQLGSADAMKDLGDLYHELGRASDARFSFESAAEGGSAGAMYNLATFAINEGDLDAAESWFRRSAEAGDPAGYAALTQLADNRGDTAAERRWAQLGAQGGHPFCMYRHGLYTVMDHPGDALAQRRALPFIQGAAESGDVDAMSLAVNLHAQLGDRDEANRWAARVRDTGDPRAIAMLEKYGF